MVTLVDRLVMLFHKLGMRFRKQHKRPTNVFRPKNREQLMRGWLLHAHKQRDRHDLAARRLEQLRIWIGVPAVGLSALVGTTVFAALGNTTNLAALGAWVELAVRLLVGLITVAAAVLTGLQTFLNLAQRAEAHHKAASQYKALIWQFEFYFAATLNEADQTTIDRDLAGLPSRLDELEQHSPVVPEDIYQKVERQYESGRVEFVCTAMGL